MSRPSGRLLAAGALVLGALGAGWTPARHWWRLEHPTFRRDIAPLVRSHCAECHAPEGVAPFALGTYEEVRKHARQMAEVTATRTMPPWLPAAGSGFAGERLLAPGELKLLARWAATGAPEGAGPVPAPLPPLPGWPLGQPDLVVTLPDSYTLAADGPDLYRNFVAPIATREERFVRAVALRPTNPQAVHHAFLGFDATGEGRRLDAQDRELGFGGMRQVGENPGSSFLSWQPGARTLPELAGAQWPLAGGVDAIFQLHLRPTGKPEPIGMQAGFYFTAEPPKYSPLRLLLRSTAIDIPAGTADYRVEAQYTLPVDVAVLAVLPHAHYFCRTMEAWSEAPDGTRTELLHIPKWNFNWQGAYRFTEPRRAAQGSTLHMRYTYDNSALQPMNRGSSAAPVHFGEQTSDEMAELWLQVAALHAGERQVLREHYVKTWATPDSIAHARRVLAAQPRDVATQTNLGALLALSGQESEAIQALQRANELDPGYAPAYAKLGQVYLQRGDSSPARSQFEQAVELDPGDFRSRNNLGFLLLQKGELEAAIAQFEEVLRTQPGDALALKNLEQASAAWRARGGH